MLSAHYEQYGRVVKVLVAHSKALQAAGVVGTMLRFVAVSCGAGEAFPSSRCAVSNSPWQWCPQKDGSLDKFNKWFHKVNFVPGIVGGVDHPCLQLF